MGRTYTENQWEMGQREHGEQKRVVEGEDDDRNNDGVTMLTRIRKGLKRTAKSGREWQKIALDGDDSSRRRNRLSEHYINTAI